MNNDYLNLAKEKMNKAISSLEERFTQVRAGRANPSMLDDVYVEYYGTPTQLKTLATIFVPEARQITIKPFDKNLLGSIEKAIFEANLGVTPNNNGEAVKQVKEYAEDGRISIRNIRKDIIDIIKKDELPEDEERNIIEDLQEVVNNYNKKVEELTKEKEKDLMEI